jgi:hypothetical protein
LPLPLIVSFLLTVLLALIVQDAIDFAINQLKPVRINLRNSLPVKFIPSLFRVFAHKED